MNAPSRNEHSVLAETVAPADNPIRWSSSTVLDILNWTPAVRSIRITRPKGFRFVPGHYVRLGLDDGTGSIVWRPFSMVSGEGDRYLEFVMVSIPGGKFSECLGGVFEGAEIFVERFSLGFLTLDQLSPGRDLWFLASGTGIGPFISILRTPSLYKGFERIVLAHSVRYSNELAYQEEIENIAGSRQLGGRLCYIPVVTRESAAAGVFQERLTVLLTQSALQGFAGIDLDVTHSRVMVCGNPELTKDMRRILSARGFQTSRRGVPGQMVFEKYW
jgi:ferredoxin/flavodoxin---NADP+ reductase